jgi:hypothetical protein
LINRLRSIGDIAIVELGEFFIVEILKVLELIHLIGEGRGGKSLLS